MVSSVLLLGSLDALFWLHSRMGGSHTMLWPQNDNSVQKSFCSFVSFSAKGYSCLFYCLVSVYRGEWSSAVFKLAKKRGKNSHRGRNWVGSWSSFVCMRMILQLGRWGEAVMSSGVLYRWSAELLNSFSDVWLSEIIRYFLLYCNLHCHFHQSSIYYNSLLFCCRSISSFLSLSPSPSLWFSATCEIYLSWLLTLLCSSLLSTTLHYSYIVCFLY